MDKSASARYHFSCLIKQTGILGNADIARRMVIPAVIETGSFELLG